MGLVLVSRVLAGTDEFAHSLSSDEVEALDLTRQGLRYLTATLRIVDEGTADDPAPRLEDLPLPDRLVRTDVEFGSGDEKTPLLLVGVRLGQELRAARLKGLELEEVLGDGNVDRELCLAGREGPQIANIPRSVGRWVTAITDVTCGYSALPRGRSHAKPSSFPICLVAPFVARALTAHALAAIHSSSVIVGRNCKIPPSPIG